MLNRDQIVGTLLSRGLSITKAAKIISGYRQDKGCTKQAVSKIVNRKGVSLFIQTKLAELMGLPYEFVWGKNKNNAESDT